MLGAGEVQAGALPARLDLRGLRRPRGPPAARGLLGPRQPDRPARRLRRGQALRRGADDGLPPPAGRRHLRSSGSSTPTARGCAPHDGRAIPTFLRQALQDKPLTVFGDGSQTRSFCYVDDLIRGLVALAESDVHLPVNIGNPDEFTLLELAETVIEVTGSRSEIVFEALPVDDPKVRQPDITRAQQLLGWEPEVELRDGLQADDRRGRRRAPRRPAELRPHAIRGLHPSPAAITVPPMPRFQATGYGRSSFRRFAPLLLATLGLALLPTSAHAATVFGADMTKSPDGEHRLSARS